MKLQLLLRTTVTIHLCANCALREFSEKSANIFLTSFSTRASHLIVIGPPRRGCLCRPCWFFQTIGSRLGVHVPLGVHLSIWRGTFKVSNEREIIFVHYFWISIHMSVNVIFKNRYVIFVKRSASMIVIIKYFIIRHVWSTCSSVEMLKGYVVRKRFGTPVLHVSRIPVCGDGSTVLHLFWQERLTLVGSRKLKPHRIQPATTDPAISAPVYLYKSLCWKSIRDALSPFWCHGWSASPRCNTMFSHCVLLRVVYHTFPWFLYKRLKFWMKVKRWAPLALFPGIYHFDQDFQALLCV